MNREPFVIYHGHCIDGFTAAWAVWKAYRATGQYYGGAYGEAPPDIRDRDVIMVDFSYPREIMKDLIRQSARLLCLDHHVTAEAALRDLPGCVFDMKRSGAMMAWEHFFPQQPAPEFVKYVQDRDLWNNKLPRTEEINAYIRSWPYDFARWNVTEHELQDDYGYVCAVGAGEAILRYQTQSIQNHINYARIRSLDGETDQIPIVNCTDRSIVSKLGHRLCNSAGTGWSASYRDEHDKRVYTLSSDGEVDVSAIAKRHGGGGHKGAAGFTKPLGAPPPPAEGG